MRPEPPSYITPSGRNRRRNRKVRRRRLVLAVAVVLLIVLVVVLAVTLPGGGTASSTSTSAGAGASSSTTNAGSGASTSETTAPLASGTVFTADLAGTDEVPAVSTSATGTVSLTVSADGSSVGYILTVDNIKNATAARLHQGKAGATGETILTLFNGPTKSGTFSGTLAVGSLKAANLEGPLKGKTIGDLVALLESGSVYLNVGTSAHTSGEIRGELK
jgi:hypothetical protein